MTLFILFSFLCLYLSHFVYWKPCLKMVVAFLSTTFFYLSTKGFFYDEGVLWFVFNAAVCLFLMFYSLLLFIKTGNKIFSFITYVMFVGVFINIFSGFEYNTQYYLFYTIYPKIESLIYLLSIMTIFMWLLSLFLIRFNLVPNKFLEKVKSCRYFKNIQNINIKNYLVKQ